MDPSDSSTLPPKVVFQSLPVYNICILFFLRLALVILILQVIAAVTFLNEAALLLFVILGAFAICSVFALVVPSRYEVLSDRSINVVSVSGKKWNFPNAVEAYQLKSLCSPEISQPKYTFAPTLSVKYLVMIRRANNSRDLLLSPTDTDEFIRVINQSKEPEIPTGTSEIV